MKSTATVENDPKRHWLASVCDATYRSEICQRPHAIAWRGEPWTVATDGKLLVALRGPMEGAEVPAPKTVEQLLGVLDQGSASTPLDWPKFRAWVGGKPSLVECRQCGGDGQCDGCHCEAPHECGYCQGSGKVKPDPSPARFRGHLIDRHRFAAHLEHFPDQPGVTADWVPNKATPSTPCLVIDGTGWRILLMPMTNEPGTLTEQAPFFEEVVPCS